MARTNLRRVFTLTALPEGPTGREMDQIAQQIVEAAQENAAEILPNLVRQAPEVLNDIDFVRRGREIRIGIRPAPGSEGRVARYLASKENREHIWLTPAVEEVMAKHRNVTTTLGIPVV